MKLKGQVLAWNPKQLKNMNNGAYKQYWFGGDQYKIDYQCHMRFINKKMELEHLIILGILSIRFPQLSNKDW